MALSCRDSAPGSGPEAVTVGPAAGIRRIAGALRRTAFPRPRASRQEGPCSPPPGPAALDGYLLACGVPLSVCGGLVGLAVLPPLGVAVPRWLILAFGA